MQPMKTKESKSKDLQAEILGYKERIKELEKENERLRKENAEMAKTLAGAQRVLSN